MFLGGLHTHLMCRLCQPEVLDEVVLNSGPSIGLHCKLQLILGRAFLYVSHHILTLNYSWNSWNRKIQCILGTWEVVSYMKLHVLDRILKIQYTCILLEWKLYNRWTNTNSKKTWEVVWSWPVNWMLIWVPPLAQFLSISVYTLIWCAHFSIAFSRKFWMLKVVLNSEPSIGLFCILSDLKM